MHLRIAVGLVLATLIVYAPVVTHEFIAYDTYDYIQRNPHVASGLSIENISWALTSLQVGNWHPLTWLSHMFDVELFGMNPAGHHATNLVIHVVNVVLLFCLLRSMTAAPWPSAFVAAAFALHPAHIESVAWVAERKDVLSTLFMLLTLLAYHAYSRAPAPGRGLLVLVLYALGLMAKPMLVTLPFVLLLLDYWPLGRIQPGREAIAPRAAALVFEKIPLFALAGGSIAVTLMAQAGSGALEPGAVLAPTERLSHAVVAYGHYLATALAPSGLAIFYPHPGSWPLWQVLLNLALLLAISGASVFWIRRYPWFFVGWAFFLGTLVPVIGIVQVGAQAWADRYTYIPYIGLFLALAFGLRELIVRSAPARGIVVAGAAALFLGYAVVSAYYLSFWRNGLTLWSHALLVTDSNYPAVIAMQASAIDRSRMLPGLSLPYFSVGVLMAQEGRHAGAMIHFDEALRLGRETPQLWYYRGYSLLALGEVQQALASFARVLELDPDNANAREEIEKIREILEREETPPAEA